MESKDAKVSVFENEVDANTKLDSCFADPVLKQTCLPGDGVAKAGITGHNSENPQKIGEILEDFLLGNIDPKENLVCSPQTAHAFCTSADMRSDLEVERIMHRARPHQNITVVIPNTDQLSSSPNITFGQTTLNMVEEFMASESPRSKMPRMMKRNKRGFLKRLFFCC